MSGFRKLNNANIHNQPYITNRGLNIYGLNAQNVTILFRYLNTNFFEDLDKLFQNSDKYILNFMYFPFDLRQTVDNVSTTTQGEWNTNVTLFNEDYDVEKIALGNIFADYGIGEANTPVNAYNLNSSLPYKIVLGSVRITPPHNSPAFLNYAPYTSVTMYLPYIGEFDLDPALVMGKILDIEYRFDITTGDCIAYVLDIEEHIITTRSGKIGFKIPLVYDSTNDEIKVVAGTVGKLVMAGVTAGVMSSATANYNAMLAPVVTSTTSTTIHSTGGQVSLKRYSRANEVRVTGSGTGNFSSTIQSIPPEPKQDTSKEYLIKSVGETTTGLFNANVGKIVNIDQSKDLTTRFNSPYPYVIIRSQEIIKPSNYNHTMGVPCAEYVTLGSLTGFTKVGAIHLENFTTATENEVSEIYSLLNDGVIF